nr:hypothetical protein [Leuven Sobemo-like virus 3]
MFVSFMYRLIKVAMEKPMAAVSWFITFLDGLVVCCTYVLTWPVDVVTKKITDFVYPPIPPKPPTITEKLLEGVEQYYVHAWELLQSLPVLHLSIVAATVLIVWLLWRFVSKHFVRMVMRTRGVYVGESMREGSKFTPALTPMGQVAIMQPGLLTDNHVGYGLRVGNVLVVPGHVLATLDSPILSYNGRKIMVSLRGRVSSRVMPDLEYIMLDDTTWTRIGVPKVRSMKDTPKLAISVTCTGLCGQSVGLLRKSTRLGLMIYMGSTLPGMSGAGYYVNGHCYGIHNGVLGNDNVGVSMGLIRRELKSLYRGETPTMEEQEIVAQGPAKATRVKTWDDLEIDRNVDDVWGGEEDELEELENRWSRNLGFDHESAPLVRQETVTLLGQGTNENTQVYQTTVVPVGLAQLEARVARVEQTIRDVGFTKCSDCSGVFVGITLEQHKRIHKKHICQQCSFVGKTAESLAEHIRGMHVKYPCDHCNVVCRTEAKLLNHRKECKVAPTESLEMKEIVTGESAFPADHRKLVKTAPFLGAPKVQRKKIGKNSLNSSPPSTSNHPSPSLEVILSAILQSQKNMEQYFAKLPHNTVGQNLATQRK